MIEAVLAEGADPEDAARRLDRIRAAAAARAIDLEALPDDAIPVLALACQKAPYLATLLARDPERLRRVAGDPYLGREKPAAVQAAELASWIAAAGPEPDADALAAALRRYRADEMVRLGVRELGLGHPAEVGRELAHLADVCLDAAIAHHGAALTARFGPPRYTDADGAVHPSHSSIDRVRRAAV